jgi:hypothetical protein
LLKISFLSINEPTPSGLKTTHVSYRVTAEYRGVIKYTSTMGCVEPGGKKGGI